MSKSARRVAQVAYDAACQALAAHWHRFSPKKFTQPQLLACLVLKEFLRLDYRGLAAHLADHAELTRSLALEVIPHYTTFQKAAARLLRATPGRKMFDAVLDRASRQGVRKRRVPLAAVDGTGNLLRGYRKSLREYKSQPDPAESLLEQLRRAVIDPYERKIHRAETFPARSMADSVED